MPAVVLLPNWNAKWHGQRGLCEWLQRIGITVLRLSLPYHDRRMAKGHERADQLWPEHRPDPPGQPPSRPGCPPLPTLAGTTRLHPPGHPGHQPRFLGRLHHLVHDEALRAGGFFHVSTYFADVVSQGMTTTTFGKAFVTTSR